PSGGRPPRWTQTCRPSARPAMAAAPDLRDGFPTTSRVAPPSRRRHNALAIDGSSGDGGTMRQTTMGARTTRRSLLAGSACVAGGALTVAGALLAWHSVSLSIPGLRLLSFSQSVGGAAGPDGKVAVVSGVVLVVGGVWIWFSPSPGLGRWAAVAVILAGVFAAALAFADIATKDSQFDSLFRRRVEGFVRDRTGISLSDQQVDRIRTTLGIHLSLRSGIFVSIAGDLIGVAGGIIVLLARVRPAGRGPTMGADRA